MNLNYFQHYKLLNEIKLNYWNDPINDKFKKFVSDFKTVKNIKTNTKKLVLISELV